MDNSLQSKIFFHNSHALGTVELANDQQGTSIRSQFEESTTLRNPTNITLSPDNFDGRTSRVSTSNLGNNSGLVDIIASPNSSAGTSSILSGQADDILQQRRLVNSQHHYVNLPHQYALSPDLQLYDDSTISINRPGPSPMVQHIDISSTSSRSSEGVERSNKDFYIIDNLKRGPVEPELEHTTRRLSAIGSMDASHSLASNTSKSVAAQGDMYNPLPWTSDTRRSHSLQITAPVSADVISSTSSGLAFSNNYPSDTELYCQSDTEVAEAHLIPTPTPMDDPNFTSPTDSYSNHITGPSRRRPRHGSPSDPTPLTSLSSISYSTIPASTPMETPEGNHPNFVFESSFATWIAEQQFQDEERQALLGEISFQKEAIS